MSTIFIVGVDGSEGSQRAAQLAAQRAACLDATLLLVHVVDWSPYEVLTPDELDSRQVDRQQEIDQAMREILEPLAKSLNHDSSKLELIVRHGHPTESLCRLAERRGAVQVFTGRRGRSKLGALLFGSVSGSLVQLCPVPITVVP